MSNPTSVVRGGFKRVARPVGEVCLVVLVAFVAIQLAVSGPVPLDAAPQPAAAGPVADWLDDVIDDLEDAADDLEEAQSAVGSLRGPLAGRKRAVVARSLEEARLTIRLILDPDHYPSLDPPNAGYVDPTADVDSLSDYARECLILIRDAQHEAVSPRVDSHSIGMRLRTIEYLMTRDGPHNYHTRAGITLSDQ